MDCRPPAAEPFFAATPQETTGLVRRRRLRQAVGLVVDSWDDWLVITVEQEQTGRQDAHSALLVYLVAARASV